MAKEYFDPIRYDFTPEELRVLGQKLARDMQKVYALRDEKKTQTDVLNLQIKAAEKELAKLSEKIVMGFELRDPETLTFQFDPVEK